MSGGLCQVIHHYFFCAELLCLLQKFLALVKLPSKRQWRWPSTQKNSVGANCSSVNWKALLATAVSNWPKRLVEDFKTQPILDIWAVKFKQLNATAKIQEAHTPAVLEKLLLKEHPQRVGDFMLIEWPNLQEELLLTTERSALMREDTCGLIMKFKICFQLQYFVNS